MNNIMKTIAVQNKTSEAEVTNGIKEAIGIAMKSTAPTAKAFWQRISPDGKEPSLEAVLYALSEQIKGSARTATPHFHQF